MHAPLQTTDVRRFARALLLSACLSFSMAVAHAVTIPTVPVGNPGNAPDPLTGNLYGSVSYDYRIGTTEVTNAQYAEFLNAKASSGPFDPLALYNWNMGGPRGGITSSFSPGGITYAVKENMGNKPVNYVSIYDAYRFTNWLHNGQGDGDTESGAYTLLGGTPVPSNAPSITRNEGAIWFVPSENEWYKAAYHQPAAQGGDIDDYWLYPTASNTPPARAFVNFIGDIINTETQVANYGRTANWWPGGYLSTVGSAGALSESFYGTSDQGGNVYELHETGFIGGSGWDDDYFMSSIAGSGAAPTDEFLNLGFRVATIPEPSTYVLTAIGIITLLCIRRRNNGGDLTAA